MSKSLLRKGLMGVLAVVILASGGYAVKTALEFQEEAAVYEQAQADFVTIAPQEVPMDAEPAQLLEIPQEEVPLAELPVEAQAVVEPEPEPLVISLVPDISVDFAGLQQVNSDVTGWLYIPNTTISYPVLQGDSNQTYIHTTYNFQESAAGSIFMDYRIAGDFSAENTVIYGHNMSSGTMFGTLKAYQDKDFALTHPYVFVLTDAGYLRYEVCYAFVTTATSQVYDLQFDQTSFANHLSYLASKTWYTTGASVSATDQILTLSTCTSVSEDQRFVVIAKLDAVVE